MTICLRYRCRNCGERFEMATLTEEEMREAQRRGRRLFAVHCPKCNRTDVEKGW